MFYVLLGALVIRLINLNQSLWLDEAILAQAITSLNLHQLFSQYLPTDFNPPLIYLIELGWNRMFGVSEISLRMPSVIFGILTIWFTYKISTKLIAKKYSIIPPILLATSGLHTYYSQEARMYSLTTLAVAISMLAILNNLKKQTHRISYFFSTLTAVYTHYLAWFILPAQFFYLIKNKSTQIKKFIFLNLLITLSYLPWLPTFLQQLKNGSTVSQTTWGKVIGGPDIKNLLLIPIKFLIGRVSLDNKIVYFSLLLLPLFLTSYLFYQARKFKFLIFWFFTPLFLIFLVSFKFPVLSYFRLLFLLPAFYLIITQGILKLKSKFHYPLIIFILSINLVSLSAYLFMSRFHREDWKTLSQTLISKSINQPIVIINAVSSPLKYYYAGNLQDYASIDTNSLGNEFWLIPYAQAIFNPDFSWENQIKSNGFTKSYEQHFIGDLTLLKYTR